ncbi:MAG: high-potential iron-sulfur protein [Gammaproteobacteria bacterium]|nr:high-potential iron-sulfur protein [Gammaproteobacteria bacterium]
MAYTHQSAKADSNCANCQLYSGTADWGPCAIFPGRQVAGAGWCSAWVKRAG